MAWAHLEKHVAMTDFVFVPKAAADFRTGLLNRTGTSTDQQQLAEINALLMRNAPKPEPMDKDKLAALNAERTSPKFPNPA